MMLVEGHLVEPHGKKNRFWHIEVPILGLATQGKTRSNALFMIKDAIETAVDKRGFKVEVVAGEGDAFTIRANNVGLLIAFMLRQQRAIHGLTLAQVARRLNVKSVNAYARYEQGKTAPSVQKLIELLHAIDPKREPVLTFR